MKQLFIPLIGFIGAPAHADWAFSAPLDLAEGLDAQTYYHLDAGGRHNIAANNDAVAVVWEDNHSGQPQVYLAVKQHSAATFTAPRRLNQQTEAYAASIRATATGFLIGWTEADTVWAVHTDGKRSGTPLRLSAGTADQLSFTVLDNGTALAVWTQLRPQGSCIYASRLQLQQTQLQSDTPSPVADCRQQQLQSHPSAAGGADGIVVAWQDRSSGVNRVYGSHSVAATQFSAPVQINESIQKSEQYGLGSSAINPVLSWHADGFWALWLDKRADRAGYKIYGAHSKDGLTWSENIAVQDSFGDETPQWSVALAHDAAGMPIAAWSDARENNGQDIYLAGYTDNAWSDNTLVTWAAGALDQDSPALTSDPQGRLHLVWRHQSEDGKQVIRYTVATADRTVLIEPDPSN